MKYIRIPTKNVLKLSILLVRNHYISLNTGPNNTYIIIKTTIVPMHPHFPPPTFFAPHPASKALNKFFIMFDLDDKISGK